MPLAGSPLEFVVRGLAAIHARKAPRPAYMPATSYFVNAEPASLSEDGPSAT